MAEFRLQTNYSRETYLEDRDAYDSMEDGKPLCLVIQSTDNADKMCGTDLSLKDAEALGIALIEASKAGKVVPQRYYIKLFDQEEGYLCKSSFGYVLDSNEETPQWKSQFTLEDIESDPELKKFEHFKIPVTACKQ